MHWHRLIFSALLLVLAASGCEIVEDTAKPTDPRIAHSLQALPEHPTYPTSNPRNSDRIVLGWRLFYDPILSGTKDVACGTCHHPLYGMSDGRTLSLGVQAKGLGPKRTTLDGVSPNLVPRHSLSVINMAFVTDPHGISPFFWDGRAHSLEEQSLFPIGNAIEMAGPGITPEAAVDSAIARLRRINLYRIYFRDAFPEEADSVAKGLLSSPITVTTLAKALAAYQREITSVNTPFDHYARGNDSALTALELQGLGVFYGKANCSSCHSGPMLSDFRMYGQGIGSLEDHGAGGFRFRTPSLRNLIHSAPYMHDGSIKTLEELIEYYDRAIPMNGALPASSLDPRFKPLHLTISEKQALLAFLLALRDDSWEDVAVPPSVVPSNLEVPR